MGCSTRTAGAQWGRSAIRGCTSACRCATARTPPRWRSRRGTSTGGESTHAVVAAHRGLADRLMFTNLGLAKKGDLFEIDVQGERLRYEVANIRVTGPDDVRPLAIEKGRDLVTLYTCTPYGVNTQRLLVTGERTDAPSGGDPGPVERLPDWLVPLVPLWGLLGVSVGRAVRGPRRRRGRHAKR